MTTPDPDLTRAERLWLACAALRGALAGAARAITIWLPNSTSTTNPTPLAWPAPRTRGPGQASPGRTSHRRPLNASSAQQPDRARRP